MQVLLVWPHQMAQTGITPGLILMIVTSLFAMWTMWLLVIFYVERKQTLVSLCFSGTKPNPSVL